MNYRCRVGLKFLVNFIMLFPCLTKCYHIMVILLYFDWVVIGHPEFFFVSALLLSLLTPIYLPSLSVSVLISFLLFRCSSVWENTRVRVPHFL